MVNPAAIDEFNSDGYVIARGLFSPEEAAQYRDHFTALRQAGTYPGDSAGIDIDDLTGAVDPLKRYPRMMQMHRWDDLTLQWMLDQRINAWLTALTGVEPFAVQTMLYFKPAGARGQALHQDQYYLRVQPGTCMAAWMALDPCDEENGCLQLVPGTQDLPLLCPVEADVTESFTDVTVPLSEGMTPTPARLEPGDVLFFNGQIVHGSFPNTSAERFRRSLIGHYIVGNAEQVSEYYHPVLRMDGSEVSLGVSEKGGQCGVWVDSEGETELEMQAM